MDGSKADLGMGGASDGVAGVRPGRIAVGLWRLAWPVLLACLLLGPGSASRAGEPDPAALLAAVTERLVEEAAGHAQDYRRDPGRARALAEDLLAPLVDFSGIARRVLGAHGRAAAPDQLDRFAAEYREFVVNTLATGFVEQIERVARYGQGVRFLPTRWSDEGRSAAAVRGRVSLEGGLPLEVDFRVRQVGGLWKVYDVVVAGVSLVQANQAAFARELDAAGVEGLTARLSAHNRSVEQRATGTRACCG
jgi:phospholipid transport system substrate-binding protein